MEITLNSIFEYTSLRIFQLNIEGISMDKATRVAVLALQHKIDVVVLQETHTETEENLRSRGSIPGFQLVESIGHKKYGVATYVKDSLRNVTKIINKSQTNDIFVLIVDISGITVANIYKPPKVKWSLQNPIDCYVHPCVYIGDFNSPALSWGYKKDTRNGVIIERWISDNDLHLVYDPEEKGTFYSPRWKENYNPDLCVCTKNEGGSPLVRYREVLDDFPRSGHRPVMVIVG